MAKNFTIEQDSPTKNFTITQDGVTKNFTIATGVGPAGTSATVDQTIIDGSTNAVSGNAVFDGLALKAPIANPTFTGIVTAPRITGRCDGLEVFCKAGLAINAGQVVYVTGASGSNIIIGLAQANAEPTSSKTIGISESTLAHNATGYAITEGLMTVSISAPSAIEGDPIWLSSTTAGGMVFGLANKPSAPNHIVYLGVVTRKTGNTVVEIYVKIQNGAELDELADVAITSPVAGQALMRGASLWENRSLVSADITDATASATPSTIVKRNAQGGAEFAGTSSIAVSVTSTAATAVNAISTNSTAVYGESGPSEGGFFASATGTGLVGFTDSGDYHAKFGNTSGDNRSFVARVSGAFGWWRGAFRGFLQAPASITSSDKTWTLPNNTGTVALTTDEMTPTAAGLTSKFGTNKATIVNGDKVTILDSAASDAPKHVLWSLIVSTLTTAFNALYVGLTGNQTVAGNKTLSGQLELTGQAATNTTSAMNRGLVRGENLQNLWLPISWNAPTGTANTSGSTVGLSVTLVSSSTSLSGNNRICTIAQNYLNRHGSGANQRMSGAKWSAMFDLTFEGPRNNEIRLLFGVAAATLDINSVAGLGLVVLPNSTNAKLQIHNGSSLLESANFSLTSSSLRRILLTWDGSTFSCYLASHTDTAEAPRFALVQNLIGASLPTTSSGTSWNMVIQATDVNTLIAALYLRAAQFCPYVVVP